MGKSFVLQDWMSSLTWKQQSTVLSSLRGSDTAHFPQLKKVGKWIRRITQDNADASSNYMQSLELPDARDIEREFEFCNVHFAVHFLQGLEIIGYKHPDKDVARKAKEYYFYLAQEVLHLNPETEGELEKRLKDLN